MNNAILWEMVCKNTQHIEIINRELGEIGGQIKWLTWLVQYIGGGIVMLLIASFVNLRMIRNNGKRLSKVNNV